MSNKDTAPVAMGDEATAEGWVEKAFLAGCRHKDAQIAELKEQIENLEARGIHTCSPKCQRLPCVQQREIAELRALVERAEPLITCGGTLNLREHWLADYHRTVTQDCYQKTGDAPAYEAGRFKDPRYVDKDRLDF